MLNVDNLTFSYGDGARVLDGLSLNLNKQEIVSLLGPSGCGKSTVLRIVAGLLTEQSGGIHWDSEPDVAFVFQDAALMPWATVQQNVSLPGRLNGKGCADISAAIHAVGLQGMENRFPAALSGGQRMRVSVARALSANPGILLMDEPFAALDEILRFQMNDLLLSLVKSRGFGVLFVTHSLYEAAYLSDRALVMDAGCIVGEVRPSLDRTQIPHAQRTSTAFLDAITQIEALMREAVQ